LNSATKYPSIPTYHVLGEKGRLTEELGPFKDIGRDTSVFLTEKVDGTNGRIVILPGGDYFIGTREELVYAKGDRVTPSSGVGTDIVRELRPVAESLVENGRVGSYEGQITVMYFEVYGHKIGAAAKQYTRNGSTGHRLFDIADIGTAILDWPRERISQWREGGGQTFETVSDLEDTSEEFGIPLVPYLIVDTGEDIPKTRSDAYGYLMSEMSETQVHLDDKDDDWRGKPEGLVLRTNDRSRIAKMRYQDYERTLNAQK